MYELDLKTMAAKHFEGRKAGSSGFKAFKVLYFFLCLDSLNGQTLIIVFNKKREDPETTQVVKMLTTLGHLTLAPFLRGWK